MPNQPKMYDVICIVCDKSFKTNSQNIKRGHGKYCSKECRLSTSQQTYNCSFCNKQFVSGKSRTKKSKTSTFFCSNDCKYKSASSLDSKYITGPFGKTDGSSTYRTRALSLLENKCSCCNYDEYVEMLDIDHVDGNRANNKLDNLQVLCVMCHAMKTRLPDEFIKKFGIEIQRNCKGCKTLLENNRRFYCVNCIKTISQEADKKRFTKINWPNKEEIIQLISSNSLLQVSKKLGVTDNAIRKYCKKLDIDYKELSPHSKKKILDNRLEHS